jgi:hypothetical protein
MGDKLQHDLLFIIGDYPKGLDQKVLFKELILGLIKGILI